MASSDNANSNYEAHDEEEERRPLMVQVTAPASLPEGYTFEALLNDDPHRTFTCEVPEGGVNEGERFWTRVPAAIDGPRLQAPTGRWKDGLCDCFSLGVCHPHVWCALFCSKIAMAQVMMRMQLTWLGQPGPRTATKNTFWVVVTLFMSYIVYSTSLEIATAEYTPQTLPLPLLLAKTIGSVLFGLWSLLSLCQTRQSVRHQYSIPEERCVGCEDICCSFFCTCCVVAQMSRHTGEYETYPGTCCTQTGLPPNAPMTV